MKQTGFLIPPPGEEIRWNQDPVKIACFREIVSMHHSCRSVSKVCRISQFGLESERKFCWFLQCKGKRTIHLRQTMQFPSNFLPVLQPTSWLGASSCVNRTIIADEPESPLLVTFAVVLDSGNAAFTHEQMRGERLTAEQVEQIARANWVAKFKDVIWEDMSGDSGMKIMGARPMGSCGDVFSSGIAIEGILKGIHHLVDGETIYVAVPDRFTILASDAAMLAHIVGGMYKDALQDQSGPLCPHVFIVEKGELIGIVEVEGVTMIPDESTSMASVPGGCVTGLVAACMSMVVAGGKANEKAMHQMFDLIAAHAERSAGSFSGRVAQAFIDDPEHFTEQLADSNILAMSVIVTQGWLSARTEASAEDAQSYKDFVLEIVHGMAGLAGGLFSKKGKPSKDEAAVLKQLGQIFSIE
jgi:hypothetical protein